MTATIVNEAADSVTIQIVIPFNRSMLETENAIQDALNEAGSLASGNLLKRFDTDGSPIVIGQTTLTSKGTVPKEYQTPYGATTVERHVYQSSKGGKTFCPMEREARIVTSATPRLAMQLSHKYAEGSAASVVKDLRLNHNRAVAKAYVQTVADAVAAVVMVKEEQWSYQLPELEAEVTTISIGIDGTCLLMCQDSWREAMVGTISLYDKAGERLHTTYIGATPEYGKKTFFKRMEIEIAKVSAAFPTALKVGVADGAKTNWPFLTQHTSRQILDFYHAAEYLTNVADAQFARDRKARIQWLNDACSSLKHDRTGPQSLIDVMQGFLASQKLGGPRSKIQAALTYFKNQQPLMKYAEHLEQFLPLGSGVTEAACKTIVKQRLCCSGMKWKEAGAAVVLSLRTLISARDAGNSSGARLNNLDFLLPLNMSRRVMSLH
jgi:hypothetical protein